MLDLFETVYENMTFASRQKGSRPGTFLVMGLLLAIGFWLRPAVAAGSRIPAGTQGTVLVKDLNLRSGPGIKYPVIVRLPKGAKVIVEFEQQGWLRVSYAGRKGYLRGLPGYIALKGPRQEKTALKTGGKAAEDMQEQLAASRKRLRQIASQEADLLRKIDTVERSLNRARRQVRAYRRQLARLDEEIARLERRKAVLQARIADTGRYAAARVVAWYKLSWIGTAQLLAGADSFFDLVVRRRSLETILASDEALLAGLIRDRAEVDSLLKGLAARHKEKQRLQRELDIRISSLGSEMKRRETLLNRIRNEKTAALAQMAALEQAAKELNRTFEALPGAKSKLRDDGAPGPAVAFGKLQGLLSMPVEGKIISFFGPYRDTRLNVVNFQNGIDVKAERGEPVRAVAAGYTMFASWVQGYGNLIIIDHGQHYYTVYAHLEEMFKAKGEAVDKDEVIATVGDSGSLTGPGLHFEIRHGGKPLDPMDWFKHK